MTTSRVPASLILWLALGASLAAAPRPPIAVSPGGEEQALRSEPCPTFSWAPSRGGGFELVIYAVTADGRLEAEPEVREHLPPGATSWTLATDRCLAPGRYAWTVRHLDSGTTEDAWARPRFLQVENPAPPELERQMERVVEHVLERWLAEGKFAARPAAAAPSPGDAAAGATAGPRSVTGAVSFDPPNCDEIPPLFDDLPNADPRCEFVKQLVADGIANLCGTKLFCPDDPVTRGQLAVYLERAMRGSVLRPMTLTLVVIPGSTASTTFTEIEGIGSTDFTTLGGLGLTRGRLVALWQGQSPTPPCSVASVGHARLRDLTTGAVLATIDRTCQFRAALDVSAEFTLPNGSHTYALEVQADAASTTVSWRSFMLELYP